MSKRGCRSFSQAFKLKVIERMAAGESASALSKELLIKRTLLYRWRDAYRSGGELALRSRCGRPTRAEALAMAAARGPAGKAKDLSEARAKIAELERKVGQGDAGEGEAGEQADGDEEAPVGGARHLPAEGRAGVTRPCRRRLAELGESGAGARVGQR